MWNLVAVMNGKIYWNELMYPDYGYYCTDLRTGETIWYKNGTDNGLGQRVSDAVLSGLGGAGVYSGERYEQFDFAQLFHYYSLNGQGVLSHLWMTEGSTWHMFDGLTGNWILSIEHVPSGTGVTDQDGSILRYSYRSSTGNYLCWNVTQSIGPPSPTGTGEQQWEPRQGAIIDAVHDTFWTDIGLTGGRGTDDITDILPRSGYTMNVTGPTDLPSLSRVLQDENRVPKMFFHYSHSTSDQEFHVAAVTIDDHAQPYSPYPDKNTAPQQTNLGFGVTKVMDKTFKDPILTGNLTYSLGSVSYEDKVFTIESKETIQKWGYSLETGQLLWGPTEPEGSFNLFGQSTYAVYGNLYSTGYCGSLYCYDILTGDLKWIYNATTVGYESPYGGNYPLSLSAICDDKIYLYSTEHSPTAPLWRGSYLRCVNATDGTEIWKVLNFVQDYALADGCFVTGNWYDQQMYVFGKGPSATTVSASPKVSVNGDSVLIEGTVMDMSPGATQDNVAPMFPNGLPAVSDDDMSAWMEYVYEQQPYPSDAKGVEVTLDAIDPNSNFVHIGTVTSDLNGDFGLAFVPDVPGVYKIIATFAGSGSYGSSYAQTMINVAEAPAEVVPTPTPASTAALYLMPATAGIIVAIVIVGLVIILLLRKR